MRAREQWLGVVDCLGYLVCRNCNEAGRGHRLDSYVFGPPHSGECCDFCGRQLVAEKSPGVAEKSPTALPGQGELPANLERDLRRLLPRDWLDWTPDRGPQ
jgi:hypothetical protein